MCHFFFLVIKLNKGIIVKNILNLAIIVNLYQKLAIVEIDPLNLAKIVNLHLFH